METLTAEQKKTLVEICAPWWHTFDFGGVIAQGVTPRDIQDLRASVLPADMTGKTVLDIGAKDGYHSFDCEKRGAIVTAADVVHRDNFDVAKKILGSNVQFHNTDLFDLPAAGQAYDIVIFYGVLYHLKNPFGAIEAARALTRGRLYLESYYIKAAPDQSIMKFYPGRELNNDPSNWWAPSIRCIHDMLAAAGFNNSETLNTHLDGRTGGRVLIRAEV